MPARPEEIDPEANLVDAASPFRAAFAQARIEGRVAGEVAAAKHATDKKRKRKTANKHVEAPVSSVDSFEVRIEKRRGKGPADASRWNDLGHDGWELVAVVGKQAFFRRSRRHASGTGSLHETGFAP